MGDTPSDSGSSPANVARAQEAEQVVAQDNRDTVASPARRPNRHQVRDQLRRPAVWGLLLLIAVVIGMQIWLLYL